MRELSMDEIGCVSGGDARAQFLAGADYGVKVIYNAGVAVAGGFGSYSHVNFDSFVESRFGANLNLDSGIFALIPDTYHTGGYNVVGASNLFDPLGFAVYNNQTIYLQPNTSTPIDVTYANEIVVTGSLPDGTVENTAYRIGAQADGVIMAVSVARTVGDSGIIVGVGLKDEIPAPYFSVGNVAEAGHIDVGYAEVTTGITIHDVTTLSSNLLNAFLTSYVEYATPNHNRDHNPEP